MAKPLRTAPNPFDKTHEACYHTMRVFRGGEGDRRTRGKELAETLLRHAAGEGDEEEVLRLLTEHNASIDATNAEGTTALHWAAWQTLPAALLAPAVLSPRSPRAGVGLWN